MLSLNCNNLQQWLKEHRYHMQMSNWNVNLLPTHAAAITKILTYTYYNWHFSLNYMRIVNEVKNNTWNCCVNCI